MLVYASRETAFKVDASGWTSSISYTPDWRGTTLIGDSSGAVSEVD